MAQILKRNALVILMNLNLQVMMPEQVLKNTNIVLNKFFKRFENECIQSLQERKKLLYQIQILK